MAVTIDTGQLENNSPQTLARILRMILNDQKDNEYASWTSVSFLDWVELYRIEGDALTLLTRDEYPQQFDDYLPNVSEGDTSYSVSTLPSTRRGPNGEHEDGVRICLGDIWNTRIIKDMGERWLTGSDSHIIDAREKDSEIHGWKLLNVEITKEEDREKVAHLSFREDETADEYLARWGWSKRTPT